MVAAIGAFATIATACSAGDDAASTDESNVGSKPEREWKPGPPKAGNLRIATFNIRNFPHDTMGQDAGTPDAGGDGGAVPDQDKRSTFVPKKQSDTDIAMLVDILDRLDFDLLAVQEINDPKEFAAILEQLGKKNGRTYLSEFDLSWEHPQHVGIVVRADRLKLEDVKVYPEVATRPTMRSAISARVKSVKAGGVDFGVMSVHLASGDTEGRAGIRAAQATQAAAVIAARQADAKDGDFIVLGDMNTAREEQEYGGLDSAYAQNATTLQRQKNDLGCTSYYSDKKVVEVQPSTIDQVYTASLAERDTSVPLTAGAHCYERACKPFESDSKEHGTSYWAVSDHCPTYFEVKDVDQD